jgi:pyruvate dehydrogenase E2 component (dihydrolipoamide acetyltransferase)
VASLLRVPEVAAGATEAVLSEWLVEENSAFTADQPIVVIETDKATVEVPAGSAAVLLRRLVSNGTTVEVGAPMALVGEEAEKGSDLDQLLAGLGVSATAAGNGGAPAERPGTGPRMGDVHAAPEPETAAEPAVAEADSALPRATPAAPEGAGSTSGAASGGGGGGGGSEAAPTNGTSSGTGTRVLASPLARRLLREAGLGTEGVPGTGPGGRIVRRDAQQAVDRARSSAPAPATPAPAAAATGAGGRGYEEVPHSRMRRAIAARLTASKQSVPHFYVKRTARIDALLDMRRQLNEVSPQKISVNDLLVRAVAITHAQVPEANAIWTDDAVRRFDSVDVAVAMASDRGLVTPVLRDVQRTAPGAIASRTKEFKRLADEGKLQQRDLEGGSVAVTNLGMFGVEEFSAIINPPQSSILAVGAGLPAPVVVDGTVQVATVMTLVLSVDHRVIDGALAARWMDLLVKAIEQPLRLLA